MLPQEIFSTFQPLRLFLVASEHLDGESLPVINIHWFPSKSCCKVWDVSRSAKLQLKLFMG